MSAYCNFFTLFLGAFFSCGLFSANLQAQTLLLQESFDLWSGQPSSPGTSWEAYTTGGCAGGDACFWAHQDSLPLTGLPAQNGCTGAGGYARAHTTGLNFGELPALWSPSLDLSHLSANAPVGLRFCFINPSQQGPDTDILQVSFSDDDGLTWDVQLFASQVENNWKEVTLPIPAPYRTASFRLKFEALGNTSSVDLGIDDIAVMDSTPVCLAAASIVSSPDPLLACFDQSPDMLHFSKSGSNGSQYTFVLTDEQDQIVEVLPGNEWNFNELPPASYRLYGVGHTGALMANLGEHIDSISAQICHLRSDNFLLIPVFLLDAQAQVSSDYNGYAVSQAGAQDGAVEVEVNGGSGVYTFDISDTSGQSFVDRTQLPAGSYTIHITDSLGCTTQASILLTEPPALTGNIHTIYPVSCAGTETGSLQAIIAGGVPPYTYQWNGQTGDSVRTDLPAGLYSLDVIDANGAQFQAQLTLTEPAPLSLATTLTQPDCAGDAGTALLSVAGGENPYVYAWEDGNSNPFREDLRAGTYNVSVQDELGCTQSATFTITAPAPLAVDWIAENPTCADREDGSVLLQIEGGTAPYAVNWADGAEATDRFGLAAQAYTLEVLDAKGCRGDYVIDLQAPAPLQIQTAIEADDRTGTQSVTVTASGGQGPYHYTWTNGDTASRRAGLETGSYLVRTTDQNGCQAELSFELEGVGRADCIGIYMGFSPNGDGINDTWVMPCITQFPENEVQVINRWGQVLYESTAYDNSWDGTAQGSPLPNGTYYYIIQFSAPTEKRTFKGTLTIIR